MGQHSDSRSAQSPASVAGRCAASRRALAEFPAREGWLGQSNKVAVVGGRGIADWLRGQPDRLAEKDRLTVSDAVAALPDADARTEPPSV